MLTMTMDTRALEGKLHELAKAARVSPGLVMKEEAKFIVQSVMRVTPPSAGRKKVARGSGMPKIQAQMQGRNAVSKDMAKVFRSLPGVYSHISDKMSFAGKEQYMATLTRAMSKGDMEAVRKLLTGPIQSSEQVTVSPYTRNGQTVSGYTQSRTSSRPALPFLTSSTQIGGPLNPNLHTARRNAYGRVTGNVISQVVGKTKELNAYRKQLFERVGWTMAGWASLGERAGAKIPAFLYKGGKTLTSGTSSVHFGEKPFIRATNFAVKIPGYQKDVDDAVGHRVKITEQKIQRLLRGRAVNLGFTRVAAR
jgi:hypothetical protein